MFVVAGVALIVTIQAVVSAKDGIEDDAGYHAVAARGGMDAGGATGPDRLLESSLNRSASVLATRATVR